MEMRRKSPLLIAITFFGGMLLLPQLSRAEDNQQQQQAFECFTCNVEKGADDTRPCVDKRETCPPGVSSCSSVVYFSRKGDPQVAHTRKFCTTLHTELTDDVLSNSSSQQQNRSTTPPSLCQNIAQWSLEQQQQKKKSNTASQSLVSSPVAVLGKLEKSEKALLVKTRRVLRRLSNKHIGIGVSNSTSSSDSASVPKQEEGRGAPSGPLRKGESRVRRGAPDDPAVSPQPPAPPQMHLSNLLCVCATPLCNKGDIEEILDRSIFRRSHLDVEKEGARDVPTKSAGGQGESPQPQAKHREQPFQQQPKRDGDPIL